MPLALRKDVNPTTLRFSQLMSVDAGLDETDPLMRAELYDLSPRHATAAPRRLLPHPPTPTPRLSLTTTSMCAFATAFGAYVGVGLLCLLWSGGFPPRGAVELSPDAVCLAAFRQAHYTRVRVYIGTPAREMRLLVRLDATLDCAAGGNTSNNNTTGPVVSSITITSSDVLHSRSVRCDADDACADVALYTQWQATGWGGHHRVNILRPMRFRYGASNLLGIESLQLGLDGEVVLCRGTTYALSARELCATIAPSLACEASGELALARGPSIEASVPSSTDPATLVTNQCALRAAGGVWADVPAALVSTCDDDCETPVAMWPSAASVSSAWLSFSTARLYDLLGEGASVASMRAAVEVGASCASQHGPLRESRATFETACRNSPVADTGSCSRGPSVTYMRTSRHRLVVTVARDGSGCARASFDATLSKVPMRETTDNDGVLAAWLRLMLMILAAAIVWVRRDDKTEFADRMFVRCVEIVAHGSSHTIVDVDAQTMTLGFIAAVLRLSLTVTALSGLQADGLLRVAVAQIGAAVLSLMHWTVLYGGGCVPAFGWLKQAGMRSALGGSTALVDVTTSAMLAFSSPPLRADGGTFDAVARLLTVVLIGVACIARCMFSAACAGVLISKPGAPRSIRLVGALTVLFWIIQAAVVAVVVADLFAVPIAYEWIRAQSGSSQRTAVLFFVTASLVAGPRFTSNSVLIAGSSVATFGSGGPLTT